MYRFVIIVTVAVMLVAGCQEAAKTNNYRQSLLKPNRLWSQKYGYTGEEDSQAAFNIVLNREVLNRNAEVLNKMKRDFENRLKRLEIKAGFADPNESAK